MSGPVLYIPAMQISNDLEPARTGKFPETSPRIPGKRCHKFHLHSFEGNQKVEFRENVSQLIDH